MTNDLGIHIRDIMPKGTCDLTGKKDTRCYVVTVRDEPECIIAMGKTFDDFASFEAKKLERRNNGNGTASKLPSQTHTA